MDTHALATIRSALRALRLERDLRGYGEMTPERRCPLIERALSLLTAIVPEAAKSPPRRAPRPHEPTFAQGLDL